MSSHHPLTKPVQSTGIPSQLPCQTCQTTPEVSRESNSGQMGLRTQRERAGRLGHHLKYISSVSGIPPLHSRPAPDPQRSQDRHKDQPQPLTGKASTSASATPTDPGATQDPSSSPSSQAAPHLPAQQQRAERLGHHFAKVSVFSDPSSTPQVHPWRVQSYGEGSPGAEPDFESRLSGATGGGSPLPDAVQSFMGSRLGADLSGVRVHTDAASAQMNREIGAQAFTHDKHIFFGEGRSATNDHLTAHELVHTIQQGAVVRSKPDDRIQTPPIQAGLQLHPQIQAAGEGGNSGSECSEGLLPAEPAISGVEAPPPCGQGENCYLYQGPGGDSGGSTHGAGEYRYDWWPEAVEYSQGQWGWSSTTQRVNASAILPGTVIHVNESNTEQGEDLSAENAAGNPIYESGNFVVVRTEEPDTEEAPGACVDTYYLHAAPNGITPQVGDQVRIGEDIVYLGTRQGEADEDPDNRTTGYSFGLHVDIRVVPCSSTEGCNGEGECDPPAVGEWTVESQHPGLPVSLPSTDGSQMASAPAVGESVPGSSNNHNWDILTDDTLVTTTGSPDSFPARVTSTEVGTPISWGQQPTQIATTTPVYAQGGQVMGFLAAETEIWVLSEPRVHFEDGYDDSPVEDRLVQIRWDNCFGYVDDIHLAPYSDDRQTVPENPPPDPVETTDSTSETAAETETESEQNPAADDQSVFPDPTLVGEPILWGQQTTQVAPGGTPLYDATGRVLEQLPVNTSVVVLTLPIVHANDANYNSVSPAQRWVAVEWNGQQGYVDDYDLQPYSDQQQCVPENPPPGGCS